MINSVEILSLPANPKLNQNVHKPGFVAETPCYGFEEDEEEENDVEVDDDNEPKQKIFKRKQT